MRFYLQLLLITIFVRSLEHICICLLVVTDFRHRSSAFHLFNTVRGTFRTISNPSELLLRKS